MKEGLVFMGVLVMLGALHGCRKAPVDDTSALENPPPKPPNCPDLPELVNVKTKDGSIVNVRIFKDGDETFYIPFSWFEWQAKEAPIVAVEVGDAKYVDRSYWDSLKNGYYSYDVHRIECPGVVHVGPFSHKTPFIKTKRYGGERNIPPNFAVDSKIDQVEFGKIYPDRPGFKNLVVENRISENIEAFGISYKAFIRVGTQHYAMYQVYDVGDAGKGAGAEWEAFRTRALSTEGWRLKRDSVRELYQWLKTPPKDRANDRIFMLGVAKQ